MFSENQLKEFNKSLDTNRVKTIDKAGMSFKYLETYDVINEANRIFNYMWDYTITRLQEVARETNQNGNHVITFSAIVKVKIYDKNRNFIEREDTGVGIGTAKNIGDAIDNASKSAVSDSLKRCFRTMGETFGNNLYSRTPNASNNNQTIQTSNQYTQTSSHQQKTFNQFDYDSLYRLNLDIVDNGNGYLIVTGDDIFAKKDSIKACGFRWDGSSKLWYKPIEQGAA